MQTVRRDMQKWMSDEIAIYRGSTSSSDESTLIESSVTGSLVWQGPCRISPSRGPREVSAGDDVIVMRDAEFLIPFDAPMPHRDDEVAVLSSYLPTLVGEWYRITDVRIHSHQATLKFSAIHSQPSRLWKFEEAGP